MNHIKSLLGAALIASFALSTQYAFSQSNSRMRTPFESVEKNDLGKRQYVYPNPHLAKMNISASYGFQPMNSFDWYNSPRFNSKWSSMVTYPSVADNNTGSFSLGFNFHATPWLEICIPFLLTYTKGNLVDAKGFRTTSYRESWFSMMPGVKMSWAYNDMWHFYSRVGVGWALGNRYEGSSDKGVTGELNHAFALAWQISPIGVEFGRRFRIFAEGGFGTSGRAVCGVKLCFGKNPENVNDSHRKADNWYESYL